jgi:hypothetical protein
MVCHLPVEITELLLPVLTDGLEAFCPPFGIISVSTGEDCMYDSWHVIWTSQELGYPPKVRHFGVGHVR